MPRGLLSGILLMLEDTNLTRAMANRLRREGYLVHCVRDLDQPAHLLRDGQPPDFLFVEVPEGERSLEETRNDIAIRLPGWSISVRDSSERETVGTEGPPGKNARRLLN